MLVGFAPLTMLAPPSPRTNEGSAALMEAISTKRCGKIRIVAPSGAAPPATVTTTSFVAVNAALTLADDKRTGGFGNALFVFGAGNAGQCAGAPNRAAVIKV